MKCAICNDTGEINGYGMLDCGAPGCTAAVERAALNTILETLPPMTAYDKYWHAYLMGKGSRDVDVKELVDQLRKMWGHAIELGETDYFDDEQFEKAQYLIDCAAAAKLIQKYKGV